MSAVVMHVQDIRLLCASFYGAGLLSGVFAALVAYGLTMKKGRKR